MASSNIKSSYFSQSGNFHSISRTPNNGNSECEWSLELDGFNTLYDYSDLDKVQESHPISSKIWETIEVPVFLIILGVIIAFIAIFINTSINAILHLTQNILNSLNFGFWEFLYYCFGVICFALLSCLTTEILCPEAIGGGISEIGVILQGTIKPILLSRKLILAKIFGLIFASSSGLSVGREGPLIHISAALANQLMKFPIFHKIQNQDIKRLDILACACSAGVASTFGTPFGGVLFSIELTSSVYSVKNLPRATFIAIISTIIIMLFKQDENLNLFNRSKVLFNTDIEPSGLVRELNVNNMDLILCCILGIICGLFGVIFVTIIQKITLIKNHHLEVLASKASRYSISRRRLIYVFIMTLFLSPLMFLEHRYIHLIEMENEKSNILSVPLLLAYLVYKSIITILSVSMPLAVGLFTPIFYIGGVIGRIFGEVWKATLPYFNTMSSLTLNELTLIGAGAFVTGVTRAISTSIIILELSNNRNIAIPLCVAVLTSYFIGNRLTNNVYDALSSTNGIPLLLEMPSKLFAIPCSKVMIHLHRNVVLSLDSTYSDAIEVLKLYDSYDANISKTILGTNIKMNSKIENMNLLKASHVIPIVHSLDKMVLIGSILRSDLKETIKRLKLVCDVANVEPISLDIQTPLRLKSLDENTSLLHSVSKILTFNDQRQYDSFEDEISQITNENLVNEKTIRVNESTISLLDENIQFIMYQSDRKTTTPIISSKRNSSIHMRSSLMPYSIRLDPSPYQVVDTMELKKVNIIFHMLKLNQTYVTQHGKLVGMITRSILRSYIFEHYEYPFERLLNQLKSFHSLLVPTNEI